MRTLLPILFVLSTAATASAQGQSYLYTVGAFAGEQTQAMIWLMQQLDAAQADIDASYHPNIAPADDQYGKLGLNTDNITALYWLENGPVAGGHFYLLLVSVTWDGPFPPPHHPPIFGLAPADGTLDKKQLQAKERLEIWKKQGLELPTDLGPVDPEKLKKALKAK